jgi:hypothetical protein
MDWWWKLFQGNSDIMIDSCTYIYIYIQVSVRDITLECLQITPTKFRGSTFPGNMHNYIWCPCYLPSFMKFCSVVSEELRWQAASVVNFGKFLSSKGNFVGVICKHSSVISLTETCIYIYIYVQESIIMSLFPWKSFHHQSFDFRTKLL